MKDKKLSVRVGVGEWIEGELDRHNSITSLQAKKGRRPLFSFQFTENEEQGHFGAAKTVKLEEIGYMGKLPCPERGDRGHGPSSNRKESSLLCQVDTEGATRVLIISDEVTGTHINDETLVRCYLANIRKEISDEEKRHVDIDALNKTLAVLAGGIDPTSSPKDETKVDLGNDARSIPLSPIDERMSNPSHCDADDSLSRSLADSEAIESELQDIVDYDEGKLQMKCSLLSIVPKNVPTIILL